MHDLRINSHGIKTDFFHIQCLLYTDDLVLIAESERDLQNMLNVLFDWCFKWRMKENEKKSKIIHFRNMSVERTNFVFKYGTQSIDIVDRYKYLGIVVNEFLNFDTTSTVVAESAGRAPGDMYNK